MSEELYNSHDYCLLAEQYEELKKENAELTADKIHLMNLFMESSEYVFDVISNMKINDLRQKCKRLEADYEISNRELLVKQVEITALRAELEAAQRWIPVSERLPELGSPILFYDSVLERINKGTCTAMNSDNTNLHWFTDDDLFYFGDRSEYITHWMPLPQPPEVQE